MKQSLGVFFILLCCCCKYNHKQDLTLGKPLVADSAYYFGSKQYILTGTLTKDFFWGSAGFGEDTVNDKRDTFLVFHLLKPIRVTYPDSIPQAGRFFDSAQVAVDMQLFGWYNKSLVPYLGRQVTLKGSLGEGVNGEMHTPVMFDFIELVK